LKFWQAAISRSADDSASDRVYLGAVNKRALGIGGIRIDPISLDRAVAALLTVMLQIEVWVTGPVPHQLVVALLGPLVTLAVAVRRLHPVAVGVGAGLLGDVVAGVWGPPSLLSYGLAWICCMYGFAVWSPPRPFAIGLTVIAVGGLVSAVGPVTFKSSVQFVVVSTVVILLVNRVVGDRERRAQIAERERDLASREAVVEERARIARELHDVIAHHVSMIVLQAGAERRVLEQSDSSAREVLETIERSGRSALTETRRLLGMLRSGDDQPLAPQPRIGDVPSLISQVRAAGLPVDLVIDGEQRELPAGIELSAYRIVQEALTNALRHAGDANAHVSIHYRPEALEIEVADDGRESPAARPGGHGLAGMRERVALYGGRLDAAREPGGGFVVHVTLPVT
jgi:signal transduction histidine kinase